MKFEGSIEFRVVEQTPDRVVSEMPVAAGVKNPFGVAHAGALLWLADVTATVLVLGKVEPSAGMLTATSEFVKRGKTLSVVRTTVRGSEGKLVADVTTSHVLSQ